MVRKKITALSSKKSGAVLFYYGCIFCNLFCFIIDTHFKMAVVRTCSTLAACLFPGVTAHALVLVGR